MRRFIVVATLLLAGFVGLHSASAAQPEAHAVVTTHAAVASSASPACSGLPFGC
jgi:hypothetical protein